ncbi:MAG: glycosyltransferase family 4 protein, partial [Planctomycetes bacterium]|nr:glycosyltransferase family 4 protein [Planctomycetota bacterium]
MRIAHLMPGSGGAFYCENCLRDATLVRAMIRAGHDVSMIPMYLPPVGGDAEGLPGSGEMFFGGVNVYLQQKFSIFRKTPRWFDRMFDSRKMLRWAGGKASMTSTKDLGETTVSMLAGESGRQWKELRRLVQWLSLDANRPDVVVLSNVLLAGLAESIRKSLGVPVVCLLQDEEGFVDSLGDDYSGKAWDAIRGCCGDIDLFISVSRYYAEIMRERLGLDEGKVRVINGGLDISEYDVSEIGPDVPVIGFLSQMCKAKGLGVLVDAFIALKSEDGLGDIRLKICGGKSGADEEFIRGVREKLAGAGFLDDVEFVEGFEQSDRVRFLQGVSVVSVPERQAAAYGLYVIEANAVGVPVVQPDAGVFGELIEATGGGVVYSGNTAEALAEALREFLVDGK